MENIVGYAVLHWRKPASRDIDLDWILACAGTTCDVCSFAEKYFDIRVNL